MQMLAVCVVTQDAKYALDEKIAICNYLSMTRPAHPLAIARAPRPWLTRTDGECAFPVAGDSLSTLACCNPSGGDAYCPAHRSALRRRRQRSAARYEADIISWLEERL
jgi:hypothetical protein